MTQFQTGELTIGDYTFKAQYIPFDVRREVGGAHHLVHADSYRGNYFFSFYNEDNEEQSAKIFEYAIKDDRLTPVAEYNIDGSDALSIDRNGILYVLETFDVYCYDLNSSDPEEPGDALDYWGRCYSSKDRDLTVLYRTNSAPVLVQDGEYTELTLEGDNEMGPFYSMSSLNLSGDELLTVGELESNGDDYFAAFDLDGNELARSSQPVGSFNAVMMKRPNGYLLDTGYMWSCTRRTALFWKSPFPWASARPCASCAATSASLMFSCRWRKTLSWQWATTAKPPSRTNRWCSASLRISEPTASAGRPTQKQRGRGRAPGPLWNNRRKRYGRNAGI